MTGGAAEAEALILCGSERFFVWVRQMALEFFFCSVVVCVRVCLLSFVGIGFFFLVCLDLARM